MLDQLQRPVDIEANRHGPAGHGLPVATLAHLPPKEAFPEIERQECPAILHLADNFLLVSRTLHKLEVESAAAVSSRIRPTYSKPWSPRQKIRRGPGCGAKIRLSSATSSTNWRNSSAGLSKTARCQA